MKHSKYLILFFLLILFDIADAQQILKVAKGHVLIDVDQNSGLRENDKVKVYKKLKSGKIINVGIVRIVFFEKSKCIGKVLAESFSHKIKAGDFIKFNNDFVQEKKKEQEARSPFGEREYAPGKSHFLTYLSVGTGIVASGLGYYFLNKANQTYSNYETATATGDAVRLYDKTVSFDTKSKISFGVGGGLVTFGIVYFFLNRGGRSYYADKAFSIKPIQKSGYLGIGFKLRLRDISRNKEEQIGSLRFAFEEIQ